VGFSDAPIELKKVFYSLVQALEIADPYTRGHSDRVASHSVALGIELGLSMHEIQILQDSGTLHDVGKIGVPRDILNKPGKLTPEEYEEIKKHPRNGYNILKPLEVREVLEITLLHHERMDGKGYPTGCADYPLLVRVLQVADVWDALTSDRPYRAGMPFAKARELMCVETNEFSFDTDVLGRFIDLTRVIYPDTDCQPKEKSLCWSQVSEMVQSRLGSQLVVVGSA
jgi:putative two-component system response regulator